MNIRFISGRRNTFGRLPATSRQYRSNTGDWSGTSIRTSRCSPSPIGRRPSSSSGEPTRESDRAAGHRVGTARRRDPAEHAARDHAFREAGRAREHIRSATRKANGREPFFAERIGDDADVVGPSQDVAVDVRGREADAGPFEHDQPDADISRDAVRLRRDLPPPTRRAVKPEHDASVGVAVLGEADAPVLGDAKRSFEAGFSDQVHVRAWHTRPLAARAISSRAGRLERPDEPREVVGCLRERHDVGRLRGVDADGRVEVGELHHRDGVQVVAVGRQRRGVREPADATGVVDPCFGGHMLQIDRARERLLPGGDAGHSKSVARTRPVA